MRSSYKIHNKEGLFFITSTIVDWVPVFSSEIYYGFLIEAIKYNQIHKNLRIFSYVLLPEHFHMIVSGDNLTNIFKSIKGYTAKEIIRQLEAENKISVLNKFIELKKFHKSNSNFQVWQESFHPKEIINDEIFQQKVDYIHFNPVKKGLVDEPHEWKYSSAGFFNDGVEGVLHLNGLD